MKYILTAFIAYFTLVNSAHSQSCSLHQVSSLMNLQESTIQQNAIQQIIDNSSICIIKNESMYFVMKKGSYKFSLNNISNKKHSSLIYVPNNKLKI